MKWTLPAIWELITKTFKEWNQKDPFRQSAVIAYYAIFSMPGLLVVIIALLGLFIEKEAVNSTIFNQIESTMGASTALQIQDIVEKAGSVEKSWWATIIGVATILLGATGVFSEFQKSLNFIWGVTPKKQKGIWKMLRVRLFSFGLIISIGFLLLISLVITSLISALGAWFQARFPDFLIILFHILNFLVSLGIITLLFALMYKILPDAKIKWKHVWLGAAVTGFLFILGKTALGIYFGKTSPEEDYGAAGSIILVLLWVSYSSMIVFFGAEFTKTYATRVSGFIPPDDHAIQTGERGDPRITTPEK